MCALRKKAIAPRGNCEVEENRALYQYLFLLN